MIVPFAWLSYADYNPSSGRWDQQQVARILTGEEGPIPFGIRFVEQPADRVISVGGVLVFPCGAYHDHGEKHIALKRLWDDMLAMPWGVVIATSDEGSTFQWEKIDPWPEHIRLWVMTPRPERSYPPGTRFIGEGSPTPARIPLRTERELDVFLSGQGGHERRDQCFAALVERAPERSLISRTLGFAQGMDRERYLYRMTRAWIAPAPSGPLTQDSFRAFEALECGAIPILDGLRPLGEGRGYWDMLGLGDLPICHDWSEAPQMIDDLLSDRHWHAARVGSLWQVYKRDVVHRLNLDVLEAAKARPHVTGTDRITVIVPTSPIPSHPDPSILFETVESVLDRLPDCEILICCDGVRPEQADRRDAYVEYLHRVTDWCLPQRGVVPYIFDEHLHQSGMLHRILPEVRTDLLLFVEHDCPLVGSIDFPAVVEEMDRSELNSMRFMHETHVLPEHEHLFLHSERGGPAWWRATIQWSQRPHVARTDFYRQIVSTYFGAGARTMIEDVMHGVVQHGTAIEGPYAGRKRAEKAWERWRLAVYHPDGNIKRSGHLDGRGEDPKYAMFIDYDDERPVGAPPEGIWE